MRRDKKVQETQTKHHFGNLVKSQFWWNLTDFAKNVIRVHDSWLVLSSIWRNTESCVSRFITCDYASLWPHQTNHLQAICLEIKPHLPMQWPNLTEIGKLHWVIVCFSFILFCSIHDQRREMWCNSTNDDELSVNWILGQCGNRGIRMRFIQYALGHTSFSRYLETAVGCRLTVYISNKCTGGLWCLLQFNCVHGKQTVSKNRQKSCKKGDNQSTKGTDSKIIDYECHSDSKFLSWHREILTIPYCNDVRCSDARE